MAHPADPVKEHLILGTDQQDAEKQRDLWLSQNPAVKVIRIHGVKREPPTLLTRMCRKHVPRVSITVEYQQPEVRSEVLSPLAPRAEENRCEEYGDGGGHQHPVLKLFAGEPDLKVKEVAQGGGGRHPLDTEAE